MFTDISEEPTALLGYVSNLWMFTDVSGESATSILRVDKRTRNITKKITVCVTAVAV